MDPVWDRALGFMDSQILFAAEDLGVFEQLDREPRTACQLAAATELPQDSAARLLAALCGMQLVYRRDDGRYENGPEAAEKLVAGKPGYVGGMFRHLREDLYPVWKHCREALIEGTNQWQREAQASGGRPKNEQLHEDPEALRAFQMGMHAVTYQAGSQLAAEAVELQQVRSIVDIGGGAGSFLIALGHQLPRLRGTVFDLPITKPIADDLIQQHGLADRLTFQGGDFWEDPLPREHDAYSLGFILHDWDDAGTAIILDKVRAASRPEGLLIVGEYLLDDDRTGPYFVARMDLNMLVAARGRERSAAEYAELLARYGFALQRVYRTGHGKSFLVARCG